MNNLSRPSQSSIGNLAEEIRPLLLSVNLTRWHGDPTWKLLKSAAQAATQLQDKDGKAVGDLGLLQKEVLQKDAPIDIFLHTFPSSFSQYDLLLRYNGSKRR